MRLEGIVVSEAEVEEEEEEFPEFSPEQEKIIQNAFGSGPPMEVLNSLKAEGLEIKRKDIRTLKGLEWLNDEVSFLHKHLYLYLKNIAELEIAMLNYNISLGDQLLHAVAEIAFDRRKLPEAAAQGLRIQHLFLHQVDNWRLYTTAQAVDTKSGHFLLRYFVDSSPFGSPLVFGSKQMVFFWNL